MLGSTREPRVHPRLRHVSTVILANIRRFWEHLRVQTVPRVRKYPAHVCPALLAHTYPLQELHRLQNAQRVPRVPRFGLRQCASPAHQAHSLLQAHHRVRHVKRMQARQLAAALASAMQGTRGRRGFAQHALQEVSSQNLVTRHAICVSRVHILQAPLRLLLRHA